MKQIKAKKLAKYQEKDDDFGEVEISEFKPLELKLPASNWVSVNAHVIYNSG